MSDVARSGVSNNHGPGVHVGWILLSGAFFYRPTLDQTVRFLMILQATSCVIYIQFVAASVLYHFFSFPTLDHVKDRNRAGKCKQGKGSSSLNIDFWHLSTDSSLILCSFQYHSSYSMPFIIWSHNILSYECFLHIHFSCCVNLYITFCINRMLVE